MKATLTRSSLVQWYRSRVTTSFDPSLDVLISIENSPVSPEKKNEWAHHLQLMRHVR